MAVNSCNGCVSLCLITVRCFTALPTARVAVASVAVAVEATAAAAAVAVATTTVPTATAADAIVYTHKKDNWKTLRGKTVLISSFARKTSTKNSISIPQQSGKKSVAKERQTPYFHSHIRIM